MRGGSDMFACGLVTVRRRATLSAFSLPDCRAKASPLWAKLAALSKRHSRAFLPPARHLCVGHPRARRCTSRAPIGAAFPGPYLGAECIPPVCKRLRPPVLASRTPQHHRDSEASGDSIFAPIVLGNGRPVIGQKIPTLVITRWWMRSAHCTVNDQPDGCPAPVIINTYAFGQSAGESTLLLSGSRGTRLGQIRSVES